VIASTLACSRVLVGVRMRELCARVGDEVLSGGVGTSESELRDPAGDEHLFPLDSQVETAASRRMEQCARGLADCVPQRVPNSPKSTAETGTNRPQL
jgi:hypothetical protein